MINREEKIDKYEKIVAKCEEQLAKNKAVLLSERKKLKEEQIKKLDDACKKAKMTIPDLINLISVMADNDIKVEDVISIIGGKKND